jgi:hypothetical protein
MRIDVASQRILREIEGIAPDTIRSNTGRTFPHNALLRRAISATESVGIAWGDGDAPVCTFTSASDRADHPPPKNKQGNGADGSTDTNDRVPSLRTCGVAKGCRVVDGRPTTSASGPRVRILHIQNREINQLGGEVLRRADLSLEQPRIRSFYLNCEIINLVLGNVGEIQGEIILRVRDTNRCIWLELVALRIFI